MEEKPKISRVRDVICRMTDDNNIQSTNDNFKDFLNEKYVKPIENLEKIADESIGEDEWGEIIDNIAFEKLKNLGNALIQAKKIEKEKIEAAKKSLEETKAEISLMNEELAHLEEEKKEFIKKCEAEKETLELKLKNGECDYKNMKLDKLVIIRNETDEIISKRVPSNKLQKRLLIFTLFVLIIAGAIMSYNILYK